MSKYGGSRQSGAVLLVLVMVTVLAGTSLFFSMADPKARQAEQSMKNARVLNQAKQALIAYAMISKQIAGTSTPGYLPCPDSDGDGRSDAPCGELGESALGWFPWLTLGTEILRDLDSVCLWYAVSGNYKVDPESSLSSEPLTAGHFVIQDEYHNSLNGVGVANYALAVIFAPGSAQGSQLRNRAGTATACGASTVSAQVNQAASYLDLHDGIDNAGGYDSAGSGAGSTPLPTDSPSVFIQARRSAAFNDQLSWISPADFAYIYSLL